jgi:hypothetical protein
LLGTNVDEILSSYLGFTGFLSSMDAVWREREERIEENRERKREGESERREEVNVMHRKSRY